MGWSWGANERVRNLSIEVLSDHWYVLRKATFEYLHRDGTWTREVREAYDRGNGVVILLYDPDAGTVLLTRQFRLPAFVNGHPDGMLIEAAAGLLDGDDPEAAIRREAEEESGVRVGEITRLFELFMSPGSVTERVTFFAATYSHAQRVSAGGGLTHEGEDIEVLELTLAEAMEMVGRGEIADGKTVLLLQWAQLQGVAGPAVPPVRPSGFEPGSATGWPRDGSRARRRRRSPWSSTRSRPCADARTAPPWSRGPSMSSGAAVAASSTRWQARRRSPASATSTARVASRPGAAGEGGELGRHGRRRRRLEVRRIAVPPAAVAAPHVAHDELRLVVERAQVRQRAVRRR